MVGGTLRTETKTDMQRIWASATDAPPHARKFVERSNPSNEDAVRTTNGQGCMLTWMLPQELLDIGDDDPREDDAMINVDDLVIRMRSLPHSRPLCLTGGSPASTLNVAICVVKVRVSP